MDLRVLTGADREAAVALWHEAELTRPWNPPHEDFDRAVAGPSSAVLGLVDEGTLAATVMVGHDGHRGWVYYLAVALDRRGHQIGRRMMEAAEAWLVDREVVKVNAMVRHANRSVLEFYDRLGYDDAEVTVLARWLGPRRD